MHALILLYVLLWGTAVPAGKQNQSRNAATPIQAKEAARTRAPANEGWEAYGHDIGGTRFSGLGQINRNNVSRLQIVWQYHTGALQPETDLNQKAAFEATPILFDSTLYLSTPFDVVIALDPATGVERWRYDPKINRNHNYSEVTSRGVAVWSDPRTSAGTGCSSRIFEGTLDARLIALDARTGRPCSDFGNSGVVYLIHGVDLRDSGDYQVTSAPTVVGDLVITGSSIGDNRAVQLERGIVRAYDARTGKLRWTWDPIPWAEGMNPRTGAANAWSTLAADPARDLVFVPTGSASPDYYGGFRPGKDEWSDAVVALRASSGKFVWGFQVVHHDLWDYDVAAQPSLLEYRHRPAIAVATKMGNLFVLDRETGKPLHAVEERPVPKSDVPGEEASPTQPIPAWSALVPQSFSAAQAWGPDPETREWCRQKIAPLRDEGMFTPPSIGGSLVVPGNIGGVNWGSMAVDQQRGFIYANTNRIPAMVWMIPRDKYVAERHQGLMGDRIHGEFAPQIGAPFGIYREFLLSPKRTPCSPPPWGALVAFDVRRGTIAWQAPHGTMAPGLPEGSPNLGGPMATAGGLVFTAASMDTYLRAFDAATGKEVWKAELPASAQATPMTYDINGQQYVVICAGGHGKLGTKQGDSVVAFALPKARG